MNSFELKHIIKDSRRMTSSYLCGSCTMVCEHLRKMVPTVLKLRNSVTSTFIISRVRGRTIGKPYLGGFFVDYERSNFLSSRDYYREDQNKHSKGIQFRRKLL